MRVRIEELFKHDIHERPENGADNIPAFSDEMKERIYSRIRRKQAFQQCDCSNNESISDTEKNRKPVYRKGLDIVASVAESARRAVACIPKENARIFRHVTNNTEDYFEEVQENSAEIYHIPMCRRICSAALTMVIAVGAVVGGRCYYSQLKGVRNTENIISSDILSSCVEDIVSPETAIENYEGEILGIKNWHIKKTKSDIFSGVVDVSFINDDTGYEFAYSECKKDDPSAYIADLDNDGIPELICNYIYAVIDGNPNNHTIIYRLKNETIQIGSIIEMYEWFAEIHHFNISHKFDFSEEYCPDINKMILTSKYIDEAYELGIEDYFFHPANSYPVVVNYYIGPLLGINKWHFQKENINIDMENTYLIDDDTGEKFVEFTGCKGKTSIYLTDLDNDQNPELVCNYQYGDSQDVLNDHVKIYRKNNGVLECGEFIDDFEEFEKDNNIELSGIEYFTSKFDPEKNRIILKKQGEDTEYDLDLKYFHFKQFYLKTAK